MLAYVCVVYLHFVLYFSDEIAAGVSCWVLWGIYRRQASLSLALETPMNIHHDMTLLSLLALCVLSFFYLVLVGISILDWARFKQPADLHEEDIKEDRRTSPTYYGTSSSA